MICSNCGCKLKEEDRFCPMCGTKAKQPMSAEQPETLRECNVWFCCPECGICFERWGYDLSEIKFGLCPNCGYSDKEEPAV